MKSRLAKEVVKIGGSLITGSGATLFYICKNEEERQEQFKKLPIEKQREIYKRSPLNKKDWVADLSAIGAIEERMASSDPNITRLPPKAPFKPR